MSPSLPDPVDPDPETGEPRCEAGCGRLADYAVLEEAGVGTFRCRWHADAAIRERRPRVLEARTLHADVPPIPLEGRERAPLVVLALIVAAIVFVAVGFAALAPVLL